MIKDKIKSGRITIGKTGIYIEGETEGGYILNLSFVNFPELKTIGISNITEDQMFVLFMDYDRITEKDLGLQLKYLNKVFGISHFLVLTTGKDKFHVISFEKFGLDELKKILRSSLVDYSYIDLPSKIDKGWILRMTPKVDYDGNVVKEKPEFCKFVEFSDLYNRPNREFSRAHIEMFNKLYPGTFKLPQLPFIDTYDTIKIIKYGTSGKNFYYNLFNEEFLDSKRLTIDWEEG